VREREQWGRSVWTQGFPLIFAGAGVFHLRILFPRVVFLGLRVMLDSLSFHFFCIRSRRHTDPNENHLARNDRSSTAQRQKPALGSRTAAQDTARCCLPADLECAVPQTATRTRRASSKTSRCESRRICRRC
jgi:hypothetical protein